MEIYLELGELERLEMRGACVVPPTALGAAVKMQPEMAFQWTEDKELI